VPKVNTPPLYDYIRNVSVENGSIEVEYKKDTLATPPPADKQPILYRSEDGIVFYYVDKDPEYEDASTIRWNDDKVPAGSRPYFYYVRINDSCTQNPPHFSDTATTLYLSVKVKSNNKGDIVWSGFNIDNIAFDHFKLEKITGANTILLGNFPRSQTTYLDDKVFDPLLDTLANVCYRITAVFTNNNDAAPRADLESHSDVVCVQPEPEAFVPQAFVPAGLNKTFKPFLLYANKDNYVFQIYDRWHRLLYSTNNVNDSWDGIYNGSPAPLDAYIYVINFTGKNGQEYTQAGTVMLIR
jgi:gliding motility-associated-like protein